MKKAALQALASYGVRTKLAIIERELRELFRDFPEAFASATPPVLLRPEKKPNGNDWPTTPTSADDTIAASDVADRAVSRHVTRSKKGWTAERKRKQMATIRAQQDAQKWGTFAWQKIHDYLKTVPKRTATSGEIMKATKINASASVVSGINARPELFDKVERGVYRLKKIVHE